MSNWHAWEGPPDAERPRCPQCDIPFPYGHVACPDGRGGCGVAHYGFQPCKCGMTVRRVKATKV